MHKSFQSRRYQAVFNSLFTVLKTGGKLTPVSILDRGHLSEAKVVERVRAFLSLHVRGLSLECLCVWERRSHLGQGWRHFLLDLWNLLEGSPVDELLGPVDGSLDFGGLDFLIPNNVHQHPADHFQVLFKDESVACELFLEVHAGRANSDFPEFLHRIDHLLVEDHFHSGGEDFDRSFLFYLVENAFNVGQDLQVLFQNLKVLRVGLFIISHIIS